MERSARMKGRNGLISLVAPLPAMPITSSHDWRRRIIVDHISDRNPSGESKNREDYAIDLYFPSYFAVWDRSVWLSELKHIF